MFSRLKNRCFENIVGTKFCLIPSAGVTSAVKFVATTSGQHKLDILNN